MLREYYKIDANGYPLDNYVLNPEADEIPDDYKLGWGGDRSFFTPKWDFELNDWIETESIEVIDEPITRELL